MLNLLCVKKKKCVKVTPGVRGVTYLLPFLNFYKGEIVQLRD